MRKMGIQSDEIDFSHYETPSVSKELAVNPYIAGPSKPKEKSGISRCSTPLQSSTKFGSKSSSCEHHTIQSSRITNESKVVKMGLEKAKLKASQPDKKLINPAPWNLNDPPNNSDVKNSSNAFSKMETEESKNAIILDKISDYMKHISALCEEINMTHNNKQVLKQSVGNIKTYFGNLKVAYEPRRIMLQSSKIVAKPFKKTNSNKMITLVSDPGNDQRLALRNNNKIRERKLNNGSYGKRLISDTNLTSFQQSL